MTNTKDKENLKSIKKIQWVMYKKTNIRQQSDFSAEVCGTKGVEWYIQWLKRKI